MSEVRVNNIVDYGGKGAPTFDNGAVISGVSSLGNQAKIGSNVTITSGGINVSGVTTAATLSGNLTGDVSAGFLTATSTVIGSGVTINAGGLNITGVCTATTFEGSGASLTGVAMTITPMAYNPDVNDSIVEYATGIGITFDHRILAGSGNVTLSVATNAGAAGTTVENFGVGSSVTIQGRKAIITPSSDLDPSETYHINYPSGAFTNTGGDVDYVGTAYTFGTKSAFYKIYAMGINEHGMLGDNSTTYRSSPVQIPGTTWKKQSAQAGTAYAITSDGKLYGWGDNGNGNLAQNNETKYSSPVQIPGTTWSAIGGYGGGVLATKTNGTLWAWGSNGSGELGLNNRTSYSSPVQVPGTTWGQTMKSIAGGQGVLNVIKTDGTLWGMGVQTYGDLGNNSRTSYSSPVQVPGTTWKEISSIGSGNLAIKTDGTLWVWGYNNFGNLGLGNKTNYSSPTQVPGTTWKTVSGSGEQMSGAIKTDGTLWMWGENGNGQLGQNSTTDTESPVQVPGTTWTGKIIMGRESTACAKTDGTMWVWGNNEYGALGLNQGHPSGIRRYSSPVQLGSGTNWYTEHNTSNNGARWVIVSERT